MIGNNKDCDNTAQTMLQMVIDGMAEEMLVIDAGYNILLANKAAKKKNPIDLSKPGPHYCYNVTHRLDNPCSEQDHLCPLKAVLNSRKPTSVVHYHFDENNYQYPVEITASPIINKDKEVIGIVEVSRDISERLELEKEQKKLEALLFQKQKDESIITLAGGIAHDFNNILTSVIGSADLILMEKTSNIRIEDHATNIIESGQRMASLTSKMLNYARKSKWKPDTVYVNKLIKESLDLAHKGKAIKADANQITQVLLDIITNSFEAMEEQGKELHIKTRNETKKHGWICGHKRTHPPGDYVHISIADDGSGIQAKDLQNIFDPFFTTKFLGRGLGLAAAYGIVQNHGGCIDVESIVGQMTTFHIYLPRRMHAIAEDKVYPENLSPKSKETILVVDDEPMIQNVIKNILERKGFEVNLASNGKKGLEILTHRNSDIGLVILDLQMPMMDGGTAYDQIKSLFPGIRVLIISGYDMDTLKSEVNLVSGDDFMLKPFTEDKLSAKVLNMLQLD